MNTNARVCTAGLLVGDKFTATVSSGTVGSNGATIPAGSTVVREVASVDRSDPIESSRITFRVRNLTDKRYAQWGDPGYTDQVILGAPRSYEVAASFKW